MSRPWLRGGQRGDAPGGVTAAPDDSCNYDSIDAYDSSSDTYDCGAVGGLGGYGGGYGEGY